MLAAQLNRVPMIMSKALGIVERQSYCRDSNICRFLTDKYAFPEMQQNKDATAASSTSYRTTSSMKRETLAKLSNYIPRDKPTFDSTHLYE
jgi:hypothetical protein